MEVAAQTPRLDFVLLWHMHQPDYRDYATGEFTLPWVCLHALKDYADMAAYLEAHPGMRAVVNFVPILLDQIEDYAEQLTSGSLRDPLLRLLARDHLDDLADKDRRLVLDSCWHANHVRMIEPFPVYRRLKQIFSLVEEQGEGALSYLSGQYLADLLTWYHLAWTGETVRRNNALVPQLLAKGERFSLADRRALLHLIRDTICGLIPRYRKLAESGRVELSSTPHFHPLAPLLIDFGTARYALPNASCPSRRATRAGAAEWRSMWSRPSRATRPASVARRGACGRQRARSRNPCWRSSRTKGSSGSRAARACSATRFAVAQSRSDPGSSGSTGPGG
jgi:alpha-amylase/alpha-mannosidase (GH57 family)